MSEIIEVDDIQVVEISETEIELVYIGIQGPAISSNPNDWEPEAGVNLETGLVVACNSSGQAVIATADGGPPAIGIVMNTALAGIGVQVRTQGFVSRSNWQNVIGSQLLTPGVDYWLSTAGQMLAGAPPSGAGMSHQRIGRAVSATTLALEITHYGRRATA